jgi:hypothetical protein
MRTRTVVATSIVSGVFATALIASPALAATGQGVGNAFGQGNGYSQQSAQTVGTCDGTGIGRTASPGRNGSSTATQGRGAGMGTGVQADLTNVASGTLTDSQKATLAAMAEEEKLAHDLYVAFADAYSTPVFTHIASAETQHLSEVRIVLERYGITDPTAGQAEGTFTTPAVQQLYDTQLAAGSTSLEAAYSVAEKVESTDVADLKAATADVTAPDVLHVYANLLAGSQRHLVVFDR